MLISALCDYYDMLAKDGKVLASGYSYVGISYLVCLTPSGEIDEIIDCRAAVAIEVGKDKIKEKLIPRNMILPERTQKTGIDANIAEHRPLYVFGLNRTNNELTPEDITGKAKKSHELFVHDSLDFLEGLNSPVVNAFRAFIEAWQPMNETLNPYLLALGKSYSSSGYAFCLTGNPDKLLHNDEQLKQKWNKLNEAKNADGTECVIFQSAITGKADPIKRIHNKVEGVNGGLTSGTVLVCYTNLSESSYGNSQSYNSNISEAAAKKYTEALNYLLERKSHKAMLGDITVVYWAMSSGELYDDLISALLFSNHDVMNADETEQMLSGLISDAKQAELTHNRISSLEYIDPDVDFYMVGLKPNSSRLAPIFIYHRKFGEILLNIARHQEDMKISKDSRPVPLRQLKRELISPKSTHDTVDSAMPVKIFESIIDGTVYPESLLSTAVRRVKTDTDIKISPARAGIIKACINRKARQLNKAEEITLALDKENINPAYLCGRLFAVLERLQQDTSDKSLNRTIRDSYFASASSKPALVFPKLLRLAQYHLNKSKSPVFFNKLIYGIITGLGNEFPDTLLLTDQGKFIIGYYQQNQNFFVKKDNAENNTNRKDN